MHSRRSLASCTAAALWCLTALSAAPLAAQESATTQCNLNPEARATTRVTYLRDPASGSEDLFVGGGAIVRCPDRGITLSSDSAEYYGDRRVWYLIGRVQYREPRLTLDSQRLTYWMAEERLLAQGSVVSRLPSGTTMRGPQMEYFRAVPGVRALARMIAPGRPQFELVQTDSAGAPQEPVRLIADRVVMDGDSLMYASGTVEITRPDVVATGDSAVIDSGREWARLLRRPRIVSTGDEAFTLEGTLIDLFSEQRRLRRVLAAGEGAIESEDLDLRSDTIDLRLANDQLQRAQAWGASRARAISAGSDILADSLDVHLPNQRLTEVRAIGDAFAQSAPDTSRFRTEERDWMRGDSIVARFDTMSTRVVMRPDSAVATASAPATTRLDTPGRADSAAGARRPPARDEATSELRELLAVGDARSYYQLAPEDSTELRPSVNFVVGRRILVSFGGGEVRGVSVEGQTFGVLLQPSVPGTPSEPAPAASPPAGAAPPPRGGRP